ncbi:hypothetical protein F4604DRAFT_1931524 [Suillus subluteus]|nr:hypothetical protein F4604DRAFT_1931524 [Suillus subluteus]
MQQSRLSKKTQKANKWNAFIKQEVEHINSELPAISEEEQEAVTADGIESIIEQQEMKGYAIHNTMISVCSDAQQTLESIDRELNDLHAHIGMEFILLRSSLLVVIPTPSIAFHFEGFCIARIQGLVKTHVEEVLDLKKKLKAEFDEWESERVQAALAENSNLNCEDDDVPTLLPNTETPTPPLESTTAAPVLSPAPSQPNPTT